MDRNDAALERIRSLVPNADPVRHLPDVEPADLPRHIAIIMDGNGRWAQERGFPRIFGHRTGAAAVRRVIESTHALGIEVLTLYSFSSENWKRPADEIEQLMQLCVTYLEGEREELLARGIRLRVLGRRDGLPSEVLDAIDMVCEATSAGTGPTLCLALNYGSRQEITDAVRSIARDVKKGTLDPSSIDEAMISSRLDTSGLPDPDLLIRTGGDLRVSNYLLWQISYAELYVTDQYWPDFDSTSLHEAIRVFARRSRRYGGLERERC